jgi:cobalt-zinc-cadmium efflux system outer membrane protein
MVVALACLNGLSSRAAAQEGITLSEAIARAQTVAPAVEVARADSLFLVAGAQAARAFPNPALALGYSRSVPRYHVEAELPIDYPWLRGPRIQAASALAAAGGFETQVARAGQRLAVELAYGQAAGARALLELSVQAFQDGTELVQIAQARQESGDAAALDVAVAQVALGDLRSTLISDSLYAADAVLALQSLLGMTQDSVVALPSDSLADVLAPSPRDAPVLRLASADSILAAERATLTYARRLRFPSPALRFGFETGDPTEPGLLPTFGISIPLPFFDRGRASVSQAAAAVQRAEAVRTATAREVAAAAASTQRRWEAALSRLSADEATIDSALQVAALAQEAYREGAYPLASVLEAQRGARDALTRRIQDLVEARSAAAAYRFAATAGGVLP